MHVDVFKKTLVLDSTESVFYLHELDHTFLFMLHLFES